MSITGCRDLVMLGALQNLIAQGAIEFWSG